MPYQTLPRDELVPVRRADHAQPPPDAHMFCLERGWRLASRTSEGEALYTKGGVNGCFRWFEVVAYETVGLLRVGHG